MRYRIHFVYFSFSFFTLQRIKICKQQTAKKMAILAAHNIDLTICNLLINVCVEWGCLHIKMHHQNNIEVSKSELYAHFMMFISLKNNKISKQTSERR